MQGDAAAPDGLLDEVQRSDRSKRGGFFRRTDSKGTEPILAKFQRSSPGVRESQHSSTVNQPTERTRAERNHHRRKINMGSVSHDQKQQHQDVSRVSQPTHNNARGHSNITTPRAASESPRWQRSDIAQDDLSTCEEPSHPPLNSESDVPGEGRQARAVSSWHRTASSHGPRSASSATYHTTRSIKAKYRREEAWYETGEGPMVMQQNMERLKQRKERLQRLGQQAALLNDAAKDFADTAQRRASRGS